MKPETHVGGNDMAAHSSRLLQHGVRTRTCAQDSGDDRRGVYFRRRHAEKAGDVLAPLEFGKREERACYRARWGIRGVSAGADADAGAKVAESRGKSMYDKAAKHVSRSRLSTIDWRLYPDPSPSSPTDWGGSSEKPWRAGEQWGSEWGVGRREGD